MGIVVRKNDRIIYYLKGADSVMQSRISQADAHFMAEACLDLAREGLRTLVVAQKNLTK
jgi:phospholipid-translocating ATPase